MLRTRTLSALVLAPPALAAAWLGGLAFAALVCLAAVLMCWEWHRIVGKSFGRDGIAAATACGLAALVALVQPLAALGLILAGSGLCFYLARQRPQPLWLALGTLYAGVPAVALVWLRADPGVGGATILWLFALVWATDVGAYAFGRLIGGPLLLPAVSPKKTWAGLIGGMVCAGLAGLGMAFGQEMGGVLALTLASAGLAVVAQAGDLWESWIKRRYGVKDSSNIIPGHGGVLDRVDGLLTVAAVVALATLVWGGHILALWR